MAWKRINGMYFMADCESDLADLPKAQMGAECYVIENATEYKCNSQNKWVAQKKDSIFDEIDLSEYATKEYVEDRVPGWENLEELI